MLNRTFVFSRIITFHNLQNDAINAQNLLKLERSKQHFFSQNFLKRYGSIKENVAFLLSTSLNKIIIIPLQQSFRFVAELFRFVARFARVRIEESSGNRFTSTAYFAKPGFVGGNVPGGETTGVEVTIRGEFSGGEYSGHLCLCVELFRVYRVLTFGVTLT